MKHIKRVAGASAGAIIATLIALGYDSRELREFLEQDLRRILVGELIVLIIKEKGLSLTTSLVANFFLISPS